MRKLASLPQKITSMLALVVTLTFTTTLVWADSALSGKLVEQWITSQKALEKWGEKHEKELDRYEEQMEQVENPFEISIQAMLKPLKATGLYNEAEKIVDSHGFKSLEHWAETTLLITKAAASIEFEKMPAMFDPSAFEGMLDNPNIPAEQRAMIESAIKHNAAMTKALQDVSSQDKDIVRPFLTQITQLMEEQH